MTPSRGRKTTSTELLLRNYDGCVFEKYEYYMDSSWKFTASVFNLPFVVMLS